MGPLDVLQTFFQPKTAQLDETHLILVAITVLLQVKGSVRNVSFPLAHHMHMYVDTHSRIHTYTQTHTPHPLKGLVLGNSFISLQIPFNHTEGNMQENKEERNSSFRVCETIVRHRQWKTNIG